MEIEKRKEGGVLIASVRGRIDAVTAPDFDQAAAEIVAAGEKTLILETGGLEYISSAGLRSILALAKALKAREGRVVFAGLTGGPKNVFKISGFETIFAAYDTVEEALKNL
ncbi:MAG TPA: STAS domain-containing protein [Syntrophales bacterium]|nr:STAS domain-containing protein [Syntrophales bacterium]HRS87042.1 STAS domain-containing protein [Syntrophales bacterium]